MKSIHESVLPEEVSENLLPVFSHSIKTPAILVDCTFGGGGHTGLVLDYFAKNKLPHKVIAMDQDIEALERGETRFKAEIQAKKLELVHASFGREMESLRGKNILGILADLGISSDQLESPWRGISFKSDGPLDMRMDRSKGETAADLLESLDEQELANVIYEFGEERLSRPIARAIISARRAGNLPKKASDLADLIFRAVPASARFGRIHPATRTFQALRIAVNHELEELDLLLSQGPELLAPGGRIGIISFHSLEDRRVKLAFRSSAEGRGFKILTKKPIEPKDAEIERNPRSRSAKLRVLERV